MKRISFLCLVVILALGCNDSTSPSSGVNIVDGFAVTNIEGMIIAIVGDYETDKANDDNEQSNKLYGYPNPFYPCVWAGIRLNKSNHVDLWLENAYPSKELNSLLGNYFDDTFMSKKTVCEVYSDSLHAGFHSFIINSLECSDDSLDEGFYRIYFRVDDEVKTFDILVLQKMFPELEDLISNE